MDLQFFQFELFIVGLIGIVIFAAYSIKTIRRAGFIRYLGGLSFAVKAIITTMSKIAVGFIGVLSSSADTSKEEDDSEEGDLTGVYNYRTRKYDNGTDPYGWYEEDL
ncbi:MAG: hypothetical protein KZQ87_17640 [Candidatus Thiodiazotropha sp. (ex Cardiolucina cf. quadrata)]|nr:hypothetical protein [Candidatus Thiodiazotropha sp. (ex Cardiolucina cf. quadrata)]